MSETASPKPRYLARSLGETNPDVDKLKRMTGELSNVMHHLATGIEHEATGGLSAEKGRAYQGASQIEMYGAIAGAANALSTLDWATRPDLEPAVAGNVMNGGLDVATITLMSTLKKIDKNPDAAELLAKGIQRARKDYNTSQLQTINDAGELTAYVKEEIDAIRSKAQGMSSSVVDFSG